MNRLGLVSVLFFAMLTAARAQAPQAFPFDERDFGAVMETAQSSNRPVFYLLYASWCPHCHKMREEVFADPEVAALLQKHYLVAAQDAEKPGGKALMRRFNASSYPSFVVVSPQGELLYGFNGEMKKDGFINEVQNSLDPKKQLPYLRSAFGNDRGNADKCLAYIYALRKAAQETDAVASSYFSLQPDAQLVSALNWKILANGVSDIGSREFQYVLRHQDEFAAISSAKRVQRKIENIALEALRGPADRLDTVGYRKQRALVNSMQLRKTDSLVFVYDKKLYEAVKDWKSYERSALAGTREFAWDQYAALRNSAAIFLSEISDQQGLRAAIAWSERSNELQPSKEGLLQTARLYEKTGDTAKAIAAARQAKEFCERIGFGTSEADELLKRLESR